MMSTVKTSAASQDGRGKSAAEVRSSIETHGAAALAALDSLCVADGESVAKMSEVMRRFVMLRDDLIAAQRAGAPCRDELQRMNSMLSSIFGIEFPSEGVQWQRACDTRDALRAFLREMMTGPNTGQQTDSGADRAGGA